MSANLPNNENPRLIYLPEVHADVDLVRDLDGNLEVSGSLRAAVLGCVGVDPVDPGRGFWHGEFDERTDLSSPGPPLLGALAR